MIAMYEPSPPWFGVCPKGECRVRLVIDYGPDLNCVYVCQITATGESLNVDQAEFRHGGNDMWAIPHPPDKIEREF